VKPTRPRARWYGTECAPWSGSTSLLTSYDWRALMTRLGEMDAHSLETITRVVARSHELGMADVPTVGALVESGRDALLDFALDFAERLSVLRYMAPEQLEAWADAAN